MSSRTVLIPPLGPEDLSVLDQFRDSWIKSLSKVQSGKEQDLTASVKSLYRYTSNLNSPRLIKCANPWQALVIPVVLSILLRHYDTPAELTKYLKSPLRTRLEQQSVVLWKESWIVLHSFLEDLLSKNELAPIDQILGTNVNALFRKRREELSIKLMEELNSSTSEELSRQLKTVLLGQLKKQEDFGALVRSGLERSIANKIIPELRGQLEYPLRASLFGPSGTPELVLSAKQSLVSQSPKQFETVKSEFRDALKNMCFGRSQLIDFSVISFASSQWEDLFSDTQMIKEVELWLSLSEHLSATTFFANACFVSSLPGRIYDEKDGKSKSLVFRDSYSVRTVSSPPASAVGSSTGLPKAKVKSLSLEQAQTDKLPGAKPSSTSMELPTPAEIAKSLDQHVIGQKEAKKVLAVAVYNHYKRIKFAEGKAAKSVGNSKSNVLLIGPTGSGKTLLTESLATTLSVPFVSVDGSSLTETGYVGEHIDDAILGLYRASNDDIKSTERGIIYIDEIDKLQRTISGAGTRDVSGQGAQQSLLKVIEAKTVTLKVSQSKEVKINTKGILFIFGGAFVGLEKVIEARLGRRQSVGFGSAPTEKNDRIKALNDSFSQACAEDLVKYGLIPELVGRIPVIAVLEELDVDVMVRILTEPKNSLFNQYSELLALDGVKLVIEEPAAKAIAVEALARETGVRGLRSIIEKIMLDLMFEIPSRKKKIKRVAITKELVERFCPPRTK